MADASISASGGAAVSGVSEGVNRQPRLVLKAADGAQLEVYLHGATITSFRTSAGQELLFTSSKAIFDGVKPIRGGIPIAFPQFADQGPLPKHGIVRDRPWRVVSTGVGAVTLELSDDESTRAAWPHAFHLTYTVTFDNTTLNTVLDVTNPKGSAGPFPFEALLHTYFFVGHDAATTTVRVGGLKGAQYVSKPEGGALKEEEADAIILDREVDRVYLNTPVDVRITGVTSGAGITGGPTFSSILIHRSAAVRDASGLHGGAIRAPLDVVVWNAHAARCASIPDFAPDDYKHYVCVEPGRVSSATADFPAHKGLKPGQSWKLIQTITPEYS